MSVFTKTENGAVTIPHPDEIQKAIDAKLSEAKALKRMKGVAYTAHGLPQPPKKAKKVKAESAAA